MEEIKSVCGNVVDVITEKDAQESKLEEKEMQNNIVCIDATINETEQQDKEDAARVLPESPMRRHRGTTKRENSSQKIQTSFEELAADRKQRLEENLIKYEALRAAEQRKEQRRQQLEAETSREQAAALKELKERMLGDLNEQRARMRLGVKKLQVYEGFRPRE